MLRHRKGDAMAKKAVKKAVKKAAKKAVTKKVLTKKVMKKTKGGAHVTVFGREAPVSVRPRVVATCAAVGAGAGPEAMKGAGERSSAGSRYH